MICFATRTEWNQVKMKLHSIVVAGIITILIPILHAAIVYELVPNTTTWFKARAGCACRGMRLVRVDTPEQNQAIKNLINGSIWTAGNILHQMNMGPNPSDKGWVWDGYGPIRPHVYKWHYGEPDNLKHQEFCIEMRYTGNWNDLNCVRERYYVCQYNSDDRPTGK